MIALFFSRTDQVGGGFGARQERQRVHDERLSGASLAGQKVEAWFKLQFELVDESKIPHARSRSILAVYMTSTVVFQWATGENAASIGPGPRICPSKFTEMGSKRNLGSGVCFMKED